MGDQVVMEKLRGRAGRQTEGQSWCREPGGYKPGGSNVSRDFREFSWHLFMLCMAQAAIARIRHSQALYQNRLTETG